MAPTAAGSGRNMNFCLSLNSQQVQSNKLGSIECQMSAVMQIRISKHMDNITSWM